MNHNLENQNDKDTIINKGKLENDLNLLRESRLIHQLNGWNEIIENTFSYIEHVIEVRVESIKIEFDTLLRLFIKMKHSKFIDKMFVLEKLCRNMKPKREEKQKIQNIGIQNIGHFETEKEIGENIVRALIEKDYVKTKRLLQKVDFEIEVEKGKMDETNRPEITPLLHYVIENSHDEIAEYLIEKGANIEVENRNQETTLFTAIKYSNEIVKLLIQKGANVNKKNNEGLTPLITGSQHGHKEVAQLLIDNGAIVNEKTNFGSTALICTSGKEVAQLLIDNGATVNDKDNDGWTALMWASNNNDKNVAQILIDNGAIVNGKDNNGWTALMWATWYRHEKVSQLLIDNGAI